MPSILTLAFNTWADAARGHNKLTETKTSQTFDCEKALTLISPQEFERFFSITLRA